MNNQDQLLTNQSLSPDSSSQPITKPQTEAITPLSPAAKFKVPKLKFQDTQGIVASLEKTLNKRIICYYTSPNSQMSESHPELFYDHLQTLGEQEELVLILISGGGSPTSALRIATLLREYCKKLTVFVPADAASAATMLALAGDEIVLSPAGFLTAIDISKIHDLNPRSPAGAPVAVSADQVQRVIQFLNMEGPARDNNGLTEGSYRTLFKYIHPLVVGDIARSSSASELIATKIMKLHPQTFANEEKIKIIANHLVKNYPMHGFPILYNEAMELGLPVRKADKELANTLYQLVKIFDSVSLPVTTHFGLGFYHVEEWPIIVESVGKRTTRRFSFERRFNPVTKTWLIENDNSRWVNVTPSSTPDKPYNITTIDVSDSTGQIIAPVGQIADQI